MGTFKLIFVLSIFSFAHFVVSQYPIDDTTEASSVSTQEVTDAETTLQPVTGTQPTTEPVEETDTSPASVTEPSVTETTPVTETQPTTKTQPTTITPPTTRTQPTPESTIVPTTTLAPTTGGNTTTHFPNTNTTPDFRTKTPTTSTTPIPTTTQTPPPIISPVCCGQNEFYHYIFQGVPSYCDPICKDLIKMCVINYYPTTYCFCLPGYCRDANGRCIPIHDAKVHCHLK